MRITTKIIQNNSLNNINTNKLLQDKLSQQMSTEKKVNRPSDDPIVAIRALRLRTNVNQVTQYYEKTPCSGRLSMGQRTNSSEHQKTRSRRSLRVGGSH